MVARYQSHVVAEQRVVDAVAMGREENGGATGSISSTSSGPSANFGRRIAWLVAGAYCTPSAIPPRADCDAMVRDLRPIYTAVNEADAKEHLDDFDLLWGREVSGNPAAVVLGVVRVRAVLRLRRGHPQGPLLDQPHRVTERSDAPSDQSPRRLPQRASSVEVLYLTIRSLDLTGRGRQRWMIVESSPSTASPSPLKADSSPPTTEPAN
jgi:hypothetical protein